MYWKEVTKMSEVRIEGSFELLSQEEWDKYMDTHIFDNMRLEDNDLGA